MERSEVLLDTVDVVAGKMGVNVLFLISDHADFLERAMTRAKVPIILATSRASVAEEFRDRVRGVRVIEESLSSSLGILGQVKELLLGAFLDGTVTSGDKVLTLATNLDALEVMIVFDVDRDIELTHLREELEDRVDMKAIESVLRLASELAREGREGNPVGTLFVIGAHETVLNRSRQGVLNPFQGHPESARSIHDDACLETLKEFALLDGAFIIRGDGIVEAAGRYLDVDKDAPLQEGLGGRHLAAASITRATEAIAVVVSSNGAIRIFRDGRVIMMVGKL